MIRSGLVNVRRGGGFEQGYPHQRDNTPRDEIVRPYVDGFDTGMGEPTNMTVIVPKPVAYTDIFSKKATPDERLYLLGMVQKGVSQMASAMNRGRPKLESAPLPGPGKPPGDMPPEGKEPGDMPPEGKEPVVDKPASDQPPPYEEGNFWTEPPAYFEGDAPPPYTLTDEIDAVDVVYGPVHQPTYEEEEKALDEWVDADFERRFKALLPERHDHNENDVTPATDFDERFKALLPKRNGFEKQGKYVDFEYPDFKLVETADISVPGERLTLEQKEDLGSRLLQSGEKVGNALSELARSSEGSYFSEAERAKIKMAAKMLSAYENLTPSQRGRFNDTLTVQEYNALLNTLIFIESRGDTYEYDTSLIEAVADITRELPVAYPQRGSIQALQSVPGGFPDERKIERVAQKEIKVNGVGPRSRTVVRKRGGPAPADTIKNYLGPRQKPKQKERRDWIGESVRRMKRNTAIDMDVDVPPRNRNPLGLTVDTSITEIDKKAPKVRKSKINSKMEKQIPDVKKKATLRKKK